MIYLHIQEWTCKEINNNKNFEKKSKKNRNKIIDKTFQKMKNVG